MRIYTIENTVYYAPPAGHVRAYLSRDVRDAALEKLRAEATAAGLCESSAKLGIVADSVRVDDNHLSIDDIADEPGTIICIR